MDTGHQTARQKGPASSAPSHHAPPTSRTPGPADPAKAAQAVQIERQLATIKAHMPETYKDIQRQAREHGNAVFSFVRRGCGGEANCFYAVEAGHVVGTPFAIPALNADLAVLMLQFGASHLIIWPEALFQTAAAAAPAPAPVHTSAPSTHPTQEASHGTH